MKFTKIALTVIVIMITSGLVNSQELTGKQVMEKYKIQDNTNDTNIKLKMLLINSSGSKREREITQVTKTDKQGNRKQLIKFLSPPDVSGTGFLSIEHSRGEDDNWLYLPALRKTRRIAGSDKTDSFMGSEFSYEDLESEDLNDYSYNLAASEKINEFEVWKIEAVPANKNKIEETAYGKRELWISKLNYLLIQAKYYNIQGVYVKLLQADDIRIVPGSDKWRAYKLIMNDVQKGSRTILEISEYKINAGVEENYFTERYLKRGK